MQKGRGLAAGAARAHRGWEMLETFVEVTKERNEGVWRGFCRGVRAGMSVLFSRVKSFPSGPEEGGLECGAAPGAALGRMGKPKQASHKQPQEHFCWDMFSSKLFLRVFLPALLSQPGSAPSLATDLQGVALTGCTPAGIFSPWVQDGPQPALARLQDFHACSSFSEGFLQ